MNRFRHNRKITRIAVVATLIFSMLEGLFAPLVAYADTPTPQISTYSTPGSYTYTVPANAQSVRVQVWGAGGSGGSGVQDSSGIHPGRGGGAGGYAESTLILSPGSTHTIVVGQGGQSAAEGGARNGGDSSFDQAVVATGGIGGDRGVSPVVNPPAGAVATHCEYEGTWVYNDEGSGNDFAISCRGGAITGFCQAGGGVNPQLTRGYHPGNYTCENVAINQTPGNVACDFEGTWVYNDNGGGNDLAFTCRSQKMTGYCGSNEGTNVPRGFHQGEYMCEYGNRQDGVVRCDFEGTWVYYDEGSSNDFAFTCRNAALTGMCASNPLQQRGGPQAGNYLCETYNGTLLNNNQNTGGNTDPGSLIEFPVLLNLRKAGETLASAFTSLFKPAVAFADMVFNSVGGQGLHGDILMTGADGAQISNNTASAGGAGTNGGTNGGGAGSNNGAGQDGGNGTVIVTVTFNDVPNNPGNQAPGAPTVTWTGSTANSPVSFTAIANDPNGDQVSCGFDWNSDGIVDEWTAFVASGASCQTSHTYAAAGSYPIQVFARDGQGAVSGAFTGTVTVTAAPVNTLMVTINATPASAVIAAGGIAPVFISSIVSGNTNAITHHGIEKSVDGGATWTNAGAWNAPSANVTRSSDASFTALVLNQAGTYKFRTYTSEDNGAHYTYSPNIATVVVTQAPGSGLAVTINATPSTAALNAGGTVTVSVSSTVTGNTNAVTHHGVEKRLNGGVWVNAGAWNVPVANTLRASDASFSGLVLNQVGTYDFRTYTSEDNGAHYTYSPNTATVTITQGSNPPSGGNSAPATPTVTWPATVTVNSAVTFNVVSTDPDNDQVQYGFDFNNDSTVDTWTAFGASGAATSTSYTFTSTGGYPIQVFARDSRNATSTAFTGTVTVLNASTGGNGGGGSSSGGGGGGSGGGNGNCYGYNCPANTAGGTTSVPNDIWITIDSVQNSGGNAGPTGPELVCPTVNFLTVFMRKGIDNNPNEVRKLQYFLNTHEGSSLTLSGVFDDATEAAVKAFQSKYSGDVLSPWGTTTPTGIVYVTTTRKINTIYCAEHPDYNGNADLSDTVIDNNVLNTPDTSGQFNGAIGQATSTSSNIAGVFGAINGRLLDALKAVHLYEWLILLLLLLAIGFILKGTLQKDIASYLIYADFTRALAALIIASVLNVLNTVSFILSPGWLADKVGLSLPWVLGLDIANIVTVVIMSLAVLVALYAKVSSIDKGPSAPVK